MTRDRLSPGPSLSTCGGTEARGGCYDTAVVTVTPVSAGVAGSHPAPAPPEEERGCFPDTKTLFYPDIDSCYIVRWEMSANHVKESRPGIGAIRPGRILEFLV